VKRALLATALLISAWSVTAGDGAGAGAVIDRGVDTAGTPLASHIDYTPPGSRALPVPFKDGKLQ